MFTCIENSQSNETRLDQNKNWGFSQTCIQYMQIEKNKNLQGHFIGTRLNGQCKVILKLMEKIAMHIQKNDKDRRRRRWEK